MLSSFEALAMANALTGANGGAVAARGGVLARTGTGTYTLTLDTPCNTAEAIIMTSLRGNSGIIQVAHTSDAVKTISTFAVDGVTATDKAFDVAVFRVTP